MKKKVILTRSQKTLQRSKNKKDPLTDVVDEEASSSEHDTLSINTSQQHSQESLLNTVQPVDEKEKEPDRIAHMLGQLPSGDFFKVSQPEIVDKMMLSELPVNRVKNENEPFTLDEFSSEGYDFCVLRGASWIYSDALKKVYITAHKQLLNVDVSYKPKNQEELFARVFLCFRDDMFTEVKRCENHISAEKGSGDSQMLRRRFLRCQNPEAEYHGRGIGKTMKSRYTIRIPLSKRIREDAVVKHTISLKFTCQNSCFGRKDLALVICLEDDRGRKLGQQLVNVKVCSCPKRDMGADEKHLIDKKRPRTISECDETSQHSNRSKVIIKDESSQNGYPLVNFNLFRGDNASYQLHIECSDRQQLVRFVEGMFEKTAADALRRSDGNQHLIQTAHKLDTIKNNLLSH